ncbi:efflux RND transporter permease subunit [Aquirufa aurantiipilula]
MKKFSFGIIILFTILSFIGILLIPKLSIQLNPSKIAGNITISYEWKNVSPEVLEREVTSKLEAVFSTLQGISKISSKSNYGNGIVTIEIDKNINIDDFRFEVASLIRQIYPQLTKDVSYPIITLNSPDEEDSIIPLMSLQLNGTANLSDLNLFAEEQLKTQLAQIEGIYAIQIFGGNKQEWVLSYDRIQLENLQIEENEIIKSISQHYKQTSLGFVLNDKGQQMNFILSPPFQNNPKTTEEIKSELEEITLAIKDKNNLTRVIHFSDILKIEKSEKPIEEFYRINGKNAVTLVIQAEKGVNQLKVTNQIKSKLTDLKRILPPTYETHIEYDATHFIQENLNKIWIQTGLAVLILLLFVWISTRNVKYTLIILISLIVNLGISFIIFYILKIEIHLYSLAAITTSLGVLIDNSIVMIDHYRRYENRQVFMALLGSTLTTMAGLIVIWFLPEETKKNLIEFANVLIIEFSISLLVALFLVPSLIEKLNIHKLYGVKPIRSKWIKIANLSNQYSQLITFLLKYRKTNILFIIIAFGASLRSFDKYVFEYSHKSNNERTSLYVNSTLPIQATVEQMNEVYVRLENYLSKIPEIDQYITRIYTGQVGSMAIYFKPEFQNGSFPYILKNKLISLTSEMSGISWDIYGIGQGFSQNIDENTTPTFNIEMRGYNYNELRKQAIILKKNLEKHPRIQDVNTNKVRSFGNNKNLIEYTLSTNPEQITLLNLTNEEIYKFLQRQNFRPQIDLYKFIQGEYDEIKVAPHDSRKFDIWALMNQPIKVANNQMIKLSNFGEYHKQNISPEIIKENQEYIQIISFEYFGSQNFGEKFLDKTIVQFKSNLPLGYSIKKKSNPWQDIENKKPYWILGVVILLIYIVCAFLFESLLQPLALITLIPISFIGVFLTFYYFNFNFDHGGYASLILLSGNVVSAGIFIISEFNNLQKIYPKRNTYFLYLKAFNHKIIPILLTVVTTIVGLIPFLIFGQNEVFWFALGAGTIGGLIFSLIGIFFYLPLFLPNLIQKKNN